MLRHCLILALCTVGAFAQNLDLKQIMDDPIWIGETPRNLHLSADGTWLYFQIPRERPHGAVWMKMPVTGGEPTAIEAADRPAALAGNFQPHGKGWLTNVAGGLWLFGKDKSPRPLVALNNNVSLVRTLQDGQLLLRMNDNLYIFHPNGGSLTQVTNFREGSEREDKENYYTVEERKLIRYVDQLYIAEDSREEDAKNRRQLGSYRSPAVSYIGKGMEPAGGRYEIDLSADKQFAAIVVEPENEGENTEYAEFIDQDTYLEANRARPRVGHETKTWKLGIVNLESNETTWVDFSTLPEIETDRLADIKEKLPEEDSRFLPKMEGPRPVFFGSGGFHASENKYLVTVYTRDYKDRWIVVVNAEDGSWELLHHHYDEAWLQFFTRGFGRQGQRATSAFWRNDGERIAFVSDHDGYQHLYDMDPSGNEARDLTPGNFEIFNPYEGPEGRYWYFHANKEHPGETHFYRMPINGGDWTAYTQEEGQHVVATNADATVMASLFARTNHPPVIRVRQKNGDWNTVYDGRSSGFKAIPWMEPEVLSYTNRDGKPVYARLYKPEKPNGAAVIFVHGAGYLQNAHKGWSGYFREYMFHNLLASQGYTVLDPDFQASAGYGRDWRTAIYRHMGGKDLNDIVDGAKFLSKEHGVDAGRIGVYGGSYGGFITLMAMFTTPEVFKAGAALRPVTDWAFYNHWYTSRILNTPTEDPDAYRRSSPIYFAEGLTGALLICHGMVDSNVHYQDSVRLAQRLIELRKHNWELSSYPVEPHGFNTPSGWYDEYRRIYELMRDNLTER